MIHPPTALALTFGQETQNTDQSLDALRRMIDLIEDLRKIGMTAVIRGNLYVDLTMAEVPKPDGAGDAAPVA